MSDDQRTCSNFGEKWRYILLEQNKFLSEPDWHTGVAPSETGVDSCSVTYSLAKSYHRYYLAKKLPKFLIILDFMLQRMFF